MEILQHTGEYSPKQLGLQRSFEAVDYGKRGSQ